MIRCLAGADFNDDDNSSVDDSGFEVASSEKSKAHQIDFKVLSVKELEERQKADAESVASILAIQVSFGPLKTNLSEADVCNDSQASV